MTHNVRWGILGCGDVTEHKSGPALLRAADSTVVAVMRRDGVRAADFAARHGIPRWYDDADALLADPAVNAVYIATPPDSHAELTVRAARAGKPVLVEKPMARTVAECETMIAACRAAQVPLHVAYYRRFYPKFLAAKRLIEDGAIGRIVGVTLQMAKPILTQPRAALPWRLNADQSGGGLFVDTGSHRIDVIRFLCGEMTEIHGHTANLGTPIPAEDCVTFSCRLQPSGALCAGECFFEVSPLRRDRLEIVGTGGVLLFDSFDDDFFTVQHGNGLVERHDYPTPAPVHLPFVEALLRVYRGEPIAHVTGLEGLETSRALCRILGTE